MKPTETTAPQCSDCFGVEMVTVEGPGDLMTVKCPHCGEGWNEPNPAARVAQALRAHRYAAGAKCCCGWRTPDPADDRAAQHEAHQAAVLATLPDIAVVAREGMRRTYRAASTLGQRYMIPQQFGTDLEEAQRWYTLQQSALDGLPGVDTVRLEYRDELLADWEPLATGGES